jgi:hypothetical protein
MNINANTEAASMNTSGMPSASPIFAPVGRPLGVEVGVELGLLVAEVCEGVAVDLGEEEDEEPVVVEAEEGKSLSLYLIQIAPAGIIFPVNVNT